MKIKKISKAYFLILLIGLVYSCDDNKLYEENYNVDNNGWRADDIKTFTFDIEDTISPVNIFINFRTSTDYPYSNLFIFLNSTYADGYTAADTLQFILTEPNGKWLGESSGTIVENQILVSQTVFNKKGSYEFKIQHAMREEILPEVIDVGFRVELMETN